MIEQKDASKLSDGRHVKNTPNPNPLTQKQKGEKQTMGNQGIQNWKLGAFFVIGLMLIAGLFGNAAIAGNGDGSIVVVADDPLPAGSIGNTLTFTYTAFIDVEGTNTPIDMNGGAVRIRIPSGTYGWKVLAGGVAVTDGGENLYPVGAKLEADGGVVPDDEASRRRITLDTDGDDVIMVEVELHAEDWSGDRTSSTDITRALVITLSSVTAAIPSSLAFPPPVDEDTQGVPYHPYEFETRSQAKGGFFRRLGPIGDSEPQPYVNVGNVESGVGIVTIDPNAVYQGEEAHNFEIIF